MASVKSELPAWLRSAIKGAARGRKPNRHARKTDRIYGAVRAAIRAAGRRGQFTPKIFAPVMSRQQASVNCAALARLGELRVVRRGGNRPTLYAMA